MRKITLVGVFAKIDDGQGIHRDSDNDNMEDFEEEEEEVPLEDLEEEEALEDQEKEGTDETMYSRKDAERYRDERPVTD